MAEGGSQLEEQKTRAGDDAIQSARDYRRYRYIELLTHLLRLSSDPAWSRIRDILAQHGWEDLVRVVVFMGEAKGNPHILLPDETIAWIPTRDDTYLTCTVQEFADWSSQHAESLYDAVVWLRYRFKQLRELTRAMVAEQEPKWQRFNEFVRSEDLDPTTGILAELGPEQGTDFGEFVAVDRRRFLFDMARGDNEGEVVEWEETPPDEGAHPMAHDPYRFACWVLDARDGLTSDWIFTRPYAWVDKIKPGWNPPPSLFPTPDWPRRREAGEPQVTGTTDDRLWAIVWTTPQGKEVARWEWRTGEPGPPPDRYYECKEGWIESHYVDGEFRFSVELPKAYPRPGTESGDS
jgi:hypothetical protein